MIYNNKENNISYMLGNYFIYILLKYLEKLVNILHIGFKPLQIIIEEKKHQLDQKMYFNKIGHLI
jgi:hypothetical protein